MTTWTLTDDVVTAINGRFGQSYAGFYGDLAPAGLASGDTIICGNDTIIAPDTTSPTEINFLQGDMGQGQMLGFNTGVTVIGGDDLIIGGSGIDSINGGGGDDTIDGGAGWDVIEYLEPFISNSAGARVVVDLAMGQSWSDHYGNDTIMNVENVVGSFGSDWIAGDADRNWLAGSDGDDVIHGRGGHDTIEGGRGNDALYGGDGDDIIADFLNGLASTATYGNNWMSGGNGNDTILAHGARTGEWSALHGDAGNDTLSGSGDGSLGLYGGEGDDSIRFGRGICYIEGGTGADTFAPSSWAFTSRESFAQVFDFEDGIDKVNLAAIPGATAANVDIRDWGANTGILMTNDKGVTTTLMLMGVTADKISFADDFVLV
ncbi:MAG TPA: hypothetical protein PK970_08810 [Hyphomicrobiaceae bacterium]|nr:hypothetical protein [Hyphomicrobiaceae bacterium]